MTTGDIKKICNLGTGTMGSGIAAVLAMAGYEVYLFGRSAESVARGFKSMDGIWKTYADYDLLDSKEIPELMNRVCGTTSLEEAAAGADFVLEAVSEDLAVKQSLFAALDTLCPARAIFASSTSGISPSLIATAIKRQDRFVAAHFLNPPHLMSLVEVIPGQLTSPQTLETTLSLLKNLGKTPVLMEREAPGFIVNRLQMALMREALYMVEEKMASLEVIDTTIKHLSRRFSANGLLEGADLGGLDVFYEIAGYLMKDLCSNPHIPDKLRREKEAGNFGAKTGQGFYNWTEDGKLAETLRTREDILLFWLQKDKCL